VNSTVEVRFEQDVVGFEQVVGSASIWIAGDQIRDQSLDSAAAASADAMLDAIHLLGEVVKTQ
tara:strand:+ start:139 stop:327 length:189 start_codon:yes stop_codon:yes gene_type:complete